MEKGPGDKNNSILHLSAGLVTYNFHLSCKPMHLSFISVCNKEHMGVITSSRNSSQSTCPECFWKNHFSFLDFTRNYGRTSGIFVPCKGLSIFVCGVVAFNKKLYPFWVWLDPGKCPNIIQDLKIVDLGVTHQLKLLKDQCYGSHS